MQAMIDIAAPAHIPRIPRIPRMLRRLAPSRWPSRWPLHRRSSLATRWLLGVRDDGVPQPGRAPLDAPSSGATPGAPSPAQAVDLLFQEHARAVLAYLTHRLPTLLDAEDALDDVFLAALNACASGQTLTGGWLMVTARRRVADFYRRSPRATPLAASDADKRRADERDEPEWVALRGEERRELLRLVARLPEIQQEALALHFGAGLQAPEIGEALGKRADAVRAILSRAMRRLREEWTR